MDSRRIVGSLRKKVFLTAQHQNELLQNFGLFAMVQLSTAESDTNQLAGTYWTMYIRGMQVMKKNIFPVRM